MEEETEEKELSFGEDSVGLNFNPGGDPQVTAIKEMYAEIINSLNNMRNASTGERARYLSVAITEAQTAQMWAVKGITKK